jgi:hypothetical protein
MPTVAGLTTADSKVSKNSSMGGKNRLDTISKRNHHAAVEVETLFWRAFCDSPDAAKEYMSDDCVMINPLFADGDAEPMAKNTEPSIDKILRGAEKWTSYRMHGTPAVAEIDLMVGLDEPPTPYPLFVGRRTVKLTSRLGGRNSLQGHFVSEREEGRPNGGI